MTRHHAFTALAANAAHVNRTMPGPVYVLELLDAGEWVAEDDYTDPDKAADQWLWCAENGLTARLIETHYDGDRADYTQEARDRIRNWCIQRGDPVPECLETATETAARERAEAMAEASATRGCDEHHDDENEGN
ncbi:hypothetical protein AN189_17480 [Loktanella sp. 3ANDIMAR09]|uniref:hypothetical protein n=1 Tax=Loktanella sp. 3ANDIMAR09 TaxID=1225657 RepID=UPI0006FB1ACB|nr:hypothetical protein [Loktanella sp. 3ANDIMAR09]KQI67017.1 hypothetical protein AN189_17480 [Loktanella sp. 3ANDIMAR09]